MEKLPPNRIDTPEVRSVGFFAQAALELVSESSWESYKLPALSPLWRLVEVRRLSFGVIRGVHPQKTLDSVIEEANKSLLDDEVLQKIFSDNSLNVKSLTIDKTFSASEIYSQSGFLIKLIGPNYRKAAEYLIVEECINRRRNSVVYSILKSYLSNLVLSGNSKSSIEGAVRKTFFQSAEGLSKKGLHDFFSCFPEKKVKFVVYGDIDESFFESISGIIGIRSVKRRSSPEVVRKNISSEKGRIIFSLQVDAFDHFSAAVSVGQMLSFGEAMLNLSQGREADAVPERFFVSRFRTGKYIEAPSRVRFSKRILSFSESAMEKYVEKFVDLLSRSKEGDNTVGANIFRSVNTASLANKSVEPEVKLLTLWAAFETLLPLVPPSATNRISHFLKYIVPSITVSYARDCFVEFSLICSKFLGERYLEYIHGIPSEKTVPEKLAAVIINGSAEQKAQLCRIFSREPLLLHRLKILENNFSDPGEFEKTVKSHAERVSWQVQRIYRERNTVMHNGESSPFVNNLLSNANYYYGTTISNIMAVSASYGGLSASHALTAIRSLVSVDYEKLTDAKRTRVGNPVRSQAMLLDIVHGHFRI